MRPHVVNKTSESIDHKQKLRELLRDKRQARVRGGTCISNSKAPMRTESCVRDQVLMQLVNADNIDASVLRTAHHILQHANDGGTSLRQLRGMIGSPNHTGVQVRPRRPISTSTSHAPTTADQNEECVGVDDDDDDDDEEEEEDLPPSDHKYGVH